MGNKESCSKLNCVKYTDTTTKEKLAELRKFEFYKRHTCKGISFWIDDKKSIQINFKEKSCVEAINLMGNYIQSNNIDYRGGYSSLHHNDILYFSEGTYKT